MAYENLSGTQSFEETDTDSGLSPSPALRSHLLEYVRMVALFARLYYGNRVIAAQNFVLSCKLQIWALVFFSFKVQIFFTRLAYGFPVNQCWPRG
jgi:hypothetical protein